MQDSHLAQFLPFLQEAGWQDATINALPGDASFRRYYRIHRGDQSAMLMHAPPPHEDPRPFLKVAHYLRAQGLRAPEILAENAEKGLVLLEDFGHVRMRETVDAAAPETVKAIYTDAVNVLVALAQKPVADVPPYTMEEYLREARLFTEYYCPAQNLNVDAAGYDAAWRAALADIVSDDNLPKVTILRDYHAENIMLLSDGTQGLLDFQDALIGDNSYDLVSLLQDARRDVAPELEEAMLAYYCAACGMDAEQREAFHTRYALLGAQRNAKIVGIFVRLWKRDGKDRYLAMIPRIWQHMEKDLQHPVLAPVATWFDENIPQSLRAAYGGTYNQ